MKALKTKPLSAHDGKIKELVLVYTEEKTGGNTLEKVKEHFKGVVNAFGKDVRYIILGVFPEDHQGSEQLFESSMAISSLFGKSLEKGLQEAVGKDVDFELVDIRWDIELLAKAYDSLINSKIDSKKLTFYDFFPKQDDEVGPSRWMQDPFMVLETPYGYPVILEPVYHRSLVSRLVGDSIVEKIGYALRPSRYYFVGGNVLAIGNRILIGRNTLDYDENKDAAPERIEEYMKWVSGAKEIIWVGFKSCRPLDFPKPVTFNMQDSVHSPLMHVDMYVSPMGSYSGSEILAVAKLKEKYVHYEKGMPSSLRKWKHYRELAKQLDDIAKKMKTHFKVVRVPIILHIRHTGPSYVLSYNNGFTEIAEKRRLYLPDYGAADEVAPKLRKLINKLNKKVERKLSDRLNMEVLFVSFFKFEHLAGQRGALHCIAKVLRREY